MKFWANGSVLTRRTSTNSAKTRLSRAKCDRVEPNLDQQTSPAGLTTQVGFIRLAHGKCPKSGKPDFGGSIIVRKKILRRGWMDGVSQAMMPIRDAFMRCIGTA